MSLRTCADCSTRYTVDIATCPHCGGSNTVTEEGTIQRLPLFVAVHCPDCGRGPWTVRLASVASGLIDLPTLACASCGSRVPVTWPPEEEPMPKITVSNGATNARDTDVSPAVVTSPPQVAAEGGLGRQNPEPEPVVEAAAEEVAETEEAVDYDGMTLAELRTAADKAGLPTYGTKAQLIERLKSADAE